MKVTLDLRGQKPAKNRPGKHTLNTLTLLELNKKLPKLSICLATKTLTKL